MDRIVRIRECQTCGMQVQEEYIGRQPVNEPMMFENKLTSVVFVPPQGSGTKYCLCKECANAVKRAIDTIQNELKGRVG